MEIKIVIPVHLASRRLERKALIDTEEVFTYSNFKINFWNEEEL